MAKTIGETVALMTKRLLSWDLILILGLSFIFRFYNFKELQYWGGDEEVLTATIRHIVWDRSPTLLVQSASLGFGLGPFYHYFLSIFYWIFDFRLVGLQAIGSILGMVTTLLIYLSGKEIGGRKLAFVAGVLYASSFFLSLVDRRVVHLTLNPVLAALTCFVLIKAVKQKFRFLPLLALPIGFAFHEDASLLVLVIAIILSWILLKIPLLKKKTILIGGLLFIFFLPFAAAEVRYNGAVVKPFVQSVLRPIQGKLHVPINYQRYIPFEYFHVLARALFLRPSEMAEEYFAYSLSFKPAYFSPALEIAILVVFATGLIWLIKNKGNNNWGGVSVLWIIQASFIFGIIVFNLVFKEIFYAHYFTVFFPVFILLFSHGLLIVFRRVPKLLFLFLCVYILLNFHTLLASRVKYPLYRKIQLVEKTLEVIGGREFSVYASDNPYVHGGGWTELYTLAKRPAVKSYWYDFWGWIYAAYSLFPIKIQTQPTDIAVFIRTEDEPASITGRLLSNYRYQDLILEVHDNAQLIGN